MTKLVDDVRSKTTATLSKTAPKGESEIEDIARHIASYSNNKIPVYQEAVKALTAAEARGYKRGIEDAAVCADGYESLNSGLGGVAEVYARAYAVIAAAIRSLKAKP